MCCYTHTCMSNDSGTFHLLPEIDQVTKFMHKANIDSEGCHCDANI